MSKAYQTLSAFQKDYQYDLSDGKSFLGEGSYGIVVEAYDHENNKKVALKIGKDLMQEFAAAKTLSHRNIAKYEACYRIADSSIGERDYAIMQLYADGNLSQLLEKVKKGEKQLSEKQLKELVKGILEGLQYLHQNKRIHRDFKPSNILISTLPDGDYRPLIADFGLTKVVGDNDYVEGSDVELSDGRGTASYKAPEQVEGENAHYNLDLWAFGVILYEILSGERPFKRGEKGTEQSRMNVLFEQIKSVQIPEQINSIPEPYQAIIRRCLVRDIHDRVRKEDELLDLLFESEPNKEVQSDETDEIVTPIKIINSDLSEGSLKTDLKELLKNNSQFFDKNYQKKIYNNYYIFLSIFFGGPLATGYLFYKNFQAFKKTKESLLFLVLFIGIYIGCFLTDIFLLANFFLAKMLLIYQHFCKSKLDYKNFNTFGFLSVALVFIIGFLTILVPLAFQLKT